MILFLIVYLNYQAVALQQPYSRIPKPIIDSLNAKYGGWRLMDNLKRLADPEVKSYVSDTTVSYPNLVWGDFNGDGRTDFTLFIERTPPDGQKEEFLIAFLARASAYEEYVLRREKDPVYIANYIWLVKKGSKVFNIVTENGIILENDGIDLIVIGKYSEVIVHTPNGFGRIITSD